MCSLDTRVLELAQSLADDTIDRIDGVWELGGLVAQATFYEPESMGSLVAAFDELESVPRVTQRDVWDSLAFECERMRGAEVVARYGAQIDDGVKAVLARAASPADTITLFRPTGPAEIQLVKERDFASWPPRLPEQPIFYPVTNEQYAAQIARDWNVKSDGYGCVTRFEVRTAFMRRYDLHQVGAGHHLEWWIPAEDLDELNANIVESIEVVCEFGDLALGPGEPT